MWCPDDISRYLCLWQKDTVDAEGSMLPVAVCEADSGGEADGDVDPEGGMVPVRVAEREGVEEPLLEGGVVVVGSRVADTI